jgi:hypothetical protein
MISIFDATGARLSVTYNGIDFNNPTLTRTTQAGHRLESVGFSTPTNLATETIGDVLKNGGGHELYNPIVGTRVLNLRGSTRGDSEVEVMDQMVNLQRALHPLSLQSQFATNHAGTLTWPPPSGLPAWVRTKPLAFTRAMPTDTAPGAFADGKFTLQYHVVPLELPDPLESSVLQGEGFEWELQFLLMDGGRSFDQSETSILMTGGVQVFTPTWNQAPIWPTYEFSMSGAGSATMSITTSGTAGDAMVLDLSALGAGDAVVIDTRDRSIWVNDLRSYSIYADGEFPILNGNGAATTITWANITNIDQATWYTKFRESDYI